VVSLRHLGLSLEDIAHRLSREDVSLDALLTEHIRRLEEEREHREYLL
jgi:hypothetical protein